jgi:hypothetical protein
MILRGHPNKLWDGKRMITGFAGEPEGRDA